VGGVSTGDGRNYSQRRRWWGKAKNFKIKPNLVGSMKNAGFVLPQIAGIQSGTRKWKKPEEDVGLCQMFAMGEEEGNHLI